MTDQKPEQDQTLEWRDGTPISRQFDDPYFSLQDGLAETRHVFLSGNDLPARFQDGFHIAELGFGTGLNFLTALDAFRSAQTGGRLHFTSFEAFPLTISEIRTALAPFAALPADVFEPFEGDAPPPETMDGADFVLQIIQGDARVELPRWEGMADAWFLDGFSPAKNPELWEATLLRQVADHTATDGTFATYTAAGHVRRALEDAGFAVSRCPGFGRKRHMTRGVLR